MRLLFAPLTIVCFLVTTTVNAQTNDKGIVVGLSPIAHTKIDPRANNEFIFPSSIVIKKQTESLLLRADLGFSRKSRTIDFTGPDSFVGTSQVSSFSLEIGIEKNISIHNLNFYVGGQSSQYLVSTKNQLGGGLDGKGDNSFTIDHWMGIAPYIGWKASLTKKISLGIESKLHSLVNLNYALQEHFQLDLFLDNSVIITYQI